MKVVICWSHISGYMAACWRAMVEQGPAAGCELFVMARASGGVTANTSFKSGIMAGIPHTLFHSDDALDVNEVRRVIRDQKPDIVVINGWHTPAYRAIPDMPEASRAKVIMAMDTPYLGTFRQRWGRFAMKGYFSKIDRVFVTGERCWQLAKVLGFPERIIRRGVYGVDYAGLRGLQERRAALPGGWPKRFISTGRYVPEKGIDVLTEGYRLYRSGVSDPWPLVCCGQGPLRDQLLSVEGIEDRGFVQPADLPEVLLHHGAFVLASRFDPWPLVIVEACAAGLPVVCSEACGTRVELLRYCFNGRTFATGEPESLAQSLTWVHRNWEHLPEMGRGSRELAAAYSAEMWVRRWLTTFQELMVEGGGRAA